MLSARTHPFLLLVLLLAPSPPAAAVEKCVSPQGKVTYVDGNCPPGFKSQTIQGGSPATQGPGTPAAAGGSGGSAAKPSGKAPVAKAAVGGPAGVTMQYYDVQGSDAATLLAALNAAGGFHAKADWKVSYTYAPKRAGRVCSVQSLSIQLELIMTLPRWTPPPSASRELFASWSRYTAALRVHEEGHLQIGRDLGSELTKSLAVTSAYCDKLDARVKGIFETLLAQHRKRDEEYDRDTAHGRTQGAVFQP